MKQLRYIAALFVGSALVTACVDDFNVGDSFLEKAPGVDVNVDSVFSKAEYTRNFLWSAYGQLYSTYTKGNMMNATPIDALSDSYQSYCTWGGPYQTYYTGLFTEDSQDNPNGNYQGKFAYKTGNPEPDGGDGRVSVYYCIRQCWLLIENIDRVPNMDDTEKSRLKGEAYTIMASRYFDAFRNFGGLCLVRKAYTLGEGFEGGRSTALQTVEFIDSLLQCAIDEPGFIWNVPNEDMGQWSGRLTRASARGLRCKLWMHAASPLFNGDKPYMEYDPAKETEFTNIEHVWFGSRANHDEHWQHCLKACQEFFADNAANGDFYQLVQPSTHDEAGYRMAYRNGYRYRNDENRHEKIFDVHMTYTMSGGSWGWGWQGFCIDGLRQGGAVPTNELMECFGTADGRTFETAYGDPAKDIYGANPGRVDIFVERDPRLYETIAVPRESFQSDVVGDYCGNKYIDTWYKGALVNNKKMNSNQDDVASGYRKFKWFLDYDKMDDLPIGVSYVRLAEIYLIKAEAEAELGMFSDALNDLHVVRSRVGLGRIETMNPALSLTSNKANLIDAILNERNCEIGAECGDRVYDMSRRMREDLYTKPLHEIHIYRLDPVYSLRMPWPEIDTLKVVDETTTLVVEEDPELLASVVSEWKTKNPAYSNTGLGDEDLFATIKKYMKQNTCYDSKSGEAWPKFEYEKVEVTAGARFWWKPGNWSNKWYLDPVSRVEIQKGYGLTQNPGW